MRTNVTFPSAGVNLAGHLYTSEGDASIPGPAVVVGHPGSAVKEQAPAVYAERLSRNGFVALAFDAAYQGESEGEPHGLEDPAHRVEDIKAAVSYLTTRDDLVDPDRIGVLGICASGGYGIAAASGDRRIKAIATVSAADLSRHFRFGGYGTADPSVFNQMLDAAAASRAAEARGEGPQGFQLHPDTAEEALARGGQYGLEGFEYYCTPRAQHPRQMKLMAWSSIDRMTFFDAFLSVDLIAPRPLLLIVGREAATAWMSIEAYQKARAPKELYWIDDATHNSLYDKDEYVSPAVARLTEFFETNLTEAADEVAFAA
jgi:fermentation-respiration switch protein FrsA (DUF1100 family)